MVIFLWKKVPYLLHITFSISSVPVTDGLGMIGSHIVETLAEEGLIVQIADNLPRQVHNGRFPDYFNKRVEFLKKDISNVKMWENSVEKGVAVTTRELESGRRSCRSIQLCRNRLIFKVNPLLPRSSGLETSGE